MLKRLYPNPTLLSSGLATFRHQESVLVSLNLLLLAVLLCLHTVFAKFWGEPSGRLMAVLALGFVLNVVELIWLQHLSQPLTLRDLAMVTWATIAVNLALALLLSVLSNTEDSPYFVLMIVPILQAAFRFSIVTVSSVVAFATVFNFTWVWVYYQHHQPVELTEYLEAGIASLVFAIVGFVVWLLVGDLRRKEDTLAKNILDLQEAREKLLLEEKLAAVGRLSSAIAHEIKNPVSLISTSIATAKQLGGSEREEMYAIASEEAERLVALTTDFLSYAHPRSLKPVATSVNDTVGYVNDACRAHASKKQVSLQVVISDPLSTEADPGQLQQALINLVLNAVEASDPGGKVTVKAYAQEHQLFIDTENSGAPIPESEQALIFEPFYTTRPKGTGLGLSIARNIARAHGGDIVLSSNQPQRICFSLTLPLSNGQPHQDKG